MPLTRPLSWSIQLLNINRLHYSHLWILPDTSKYSPVLWSRRSIIWKQCIQLPQQTLLLSLLTPNLHRVLKLFLPRYLVSSGQAPNSSYSCKLLYNLHTHGSRCTGLPCCDWCMHKTRGSLELSRRWKGPRKFNHNLIMVVMGDYGGHRGRSWNMCLFGRILGEHCHLVIMNETWTSRRSYFCLWKCLDFKETESKNWRFLHDPESRQGTPRIINRFKHHNRVHVHRLSQLAVNPDLPLITKSIQSIFAEMVEQLLLIFWWDSICIAYWLSLEPFLDPSSA